MKLSLLKLAFIMRVIRIIGSTFAFRSERSLIDWPYVNPLVSIVNFHRSIREIFKFDYAGYTQIIIVIYLEFSCLRD
jgi:hypothetical protein